MPSSHPPPPRRNILLVGDSDIARWPAHLYPCLPGTPITDNKHGNNRNHLVSGHSGATLSEIVVMPHVQETLKSADDTQHEGYILVVCAGENDIGQGTPLETSVQALQKLLDLVFLESNNTPQPKPSRHLIFLGPKFEPWLNDDVASKKAYSAMDRAFSRCCEQHAASSNIHYVDCLVMFCGTTASLPGARLGGKAQAQDQFFDADELHLNDHGYEVWKDVVETTIQQKCL